MNLADVCNHLKLSVIPHTPGDFAIAEAFKHGLSDEELRAGIAAFRRFLYDLYDALAHNWYAFDIKTASLHGTIPMRFPIIEELGVILFSLGFHGRLEAVPRCELVVHGSDMIKVSQMQKYKHLNKMSKKRRVELFDFLSGLGFYFEDADFSAGIDFSKIGTFYVQYENDDMLLIGLKLMALAQANVKAKYDRYTTIMMRGDFYPLADARPKPHVVNITEYANTQPLEIKEWIIDLDKLLTQSCKVDGEVKYSLCGGAFFYTSRKTKKRVCTINMLVYGGTIIPSAEHIVVPGNILDETTENMLDVMRKRHRACGRCQEVNNPTFAKCPHGGQSHRFTIKGEEFELCRFGGFEFSLDKACDRDVLRKLVEMELAWDG